MRAARLPSWTLLHRWLLGMALVTWRYLWMTTPLHRHEHDVQERCQPPPLDPGTAQDRLQPIESGVGPSYHRTFRVRVAQARATAEQLMTAVISDIELFMPREVVRVRSRETAPSAVLEPGDEMVVDMPGPWNGPVRVISADPRRLRLATLEGHLEAGQIEFRAFELDDELVFEIEAWARPGSRAVHLLYSRLHLAKEIQCNMWVRFCLSAADIAGGRPVDGVEIETHVHRS